MLSTALVEHEFWRELWSDGRVDFHQPTGHPRLSDLVADLPIGRALVPLAGKSVDIVALRHRGYEVVAVELVEQALRAFAEEQPALGLAPHHGQLGFELRGDGVRFMAADFFEVDESEVGRFDLVYDRAALIALPPSRRPAYVDHLRRLLRPDGRVAALTVEYDETEMDGPPFSVSPAAVSALYDGALIESPDDGRELPVPPRLAERGLTHLVEHAFRICHAAQ